MKNKLSFEILNFLPGCIILTFGMLALYSSVALIQDREISQSIYYHFSNDVLQLQKSLYAFEATNDRYLTSQNTTNHEAVKSQLVDLNDQLQNMQKHHNSFIPDQVNEESYDMYQLDLYNISRDIRDLSKIVATYESDKTTNHKDRSEAAIAGKVQSISEGLSNLQRGVLKGFEEASVIQNREEKEVWLYWSVIAMGLSGFVLIVLNSDKLRKVRRLNAKRRQDLELLEKRLSALDLASEGIIIIGHDNEVTYLNNSLCRILGLEPETRDTLLGKNWSDIFPEDAAASLKDTMWSSIEAEGLWEDRFQLEVDGDVIHTEMSFTKLPDGGMIATIEDITEEYNTENERKDLEERFYQAQKMEAIGRLAGGIAHDFNNILAAMNGNAEFLVEDLEEQKDLQKFAQNILQAGVQARSLVDKMLAFSRRSDNALMTVDLLEPITESIAMLEATLPKTIEVKHSFGVKNAHVLGNATQLSQLLMNLGVNARDAIDEEYGAITISVNEHKARDIKVPNCIKPDLPDSKDTPSYVLREIDPGHSQIILGHVCDDYDYVCLSVEDTGSGMSHVIMQHIFEPFFTTKSVEKGTGLGMATVMGIVAIHKSMLVIDSVLGKGTTFDIYMPLATEEENIMPEDDRLTADTTDIKTTQGGGKHILLVEDQENVRVMVTEMLGRLKYDVSCAVSGLDGLDMIRDNPDLYDLVITDYNMPKMTGLEMAQQIHLDLPDLPFILLSGYNEQKLHDIINRHPAIKTVLSKPIGKEALAKEINKIMKRMAA